MADLVLRPGKRRVTPAVTAFARSVSGPTAQVVTGVLGVPGAGWLGDVPPGSLAGVPGSVVAIGPVRGGGVPA